MTPTPGASSASAPPPPAADPRPEAEPGLEVIALPRRGPQELSLTLRPLEGEGLEQTFSRLAGVLQGVGGEALTLTVFGPARARAEAMEVLERSLGRVDWPVTWLEGGPCVDAPIAGVQARVVRGAVPKTLRLRGRPVGRVFEDEGVTYCWLGDLAPADLTASRPDQALAMFEEMEAALGLAGLGMGDLARTWLFMDGMLSWYGDFNRVRTGFFTQRGLFGGLVPASTGIGARNPAGAAVVAKALAVRSADGSPIVRRVPSPLQCEAGTYGSSFSRAVELEAAGCRQLFISGTASIDPNGVSAHRGDLDAQVSLTLRVVEALLASRGMGLPNVTRAVAYLKRRADAPAFDRWREARDLRSLPVVVTECDVCRDELLFEIEVDAAAPA